MKQLRQLRGTHGRATELELEESDIKVADHSATVSCWFIDAPGQSLFWQHYLLGIYHLRPIEGSDKPIKKLYDGVTHELSLIALDPDRRPKVDDMQTWRHLVPINFVMQVELASDEQAKELLMLASKGIVDGLLWAEPPLSGQKEPWLSSMLQTSAHLRGEAHGGHPNH